MRQGEQSGYEKAYIRRDKLYLHVKEIVGKREVERSNRDCIPRFSKGVE